MARPSAVMVGVGVAATLGLTSPTHGQTAPTPSAAVSASGQLLYTEACATCHGADGAGQRSQRIPSLHGVGAAAVDFYLSTGRMPEATLASQAPRKPPSVSPAERAALVAYVTATWPGGPAIPDVRTDSGRTGSVPGGSVPGGSVPAGSVQAGGDLFRTNCAACHGAAAAGAALANGAYAPSLHKSDALQVAEAIRVGPGNMPVFDVTTLSDSQVADIDAYVQYLRHPDDRGGAGLGHTGPVAEGFVGLLFAMGGALLIAAWVGHRTDDTPKERTP